MTRAIRYLTLEPGMTYTVDPESADGFESEPISLKAALELVHELMNGESSWEILVFRDEDGEVLNFANAGGTDTLGFSTPILALREWGTNLVATTSGDYSQCSDAVEAFFEGYVYLKRFFRTLDFFTIDTVEAAAESAEESTDSPVKEREVVTREVVMIPCEYCEKLMPQDALRCPRCGAPR